MKLVLWNITRDIENDHLSSTLHSRLLPWGLAAAFSGTLLSLSCPRWWSDGYSALRLILLLSSCPLPRAPLSIRVSVSPHVLVLLCFMGKVSKMIEMSLRRELWLKCLLPARCVCSFLSHQLPGARHGIWMRLKSNFPCSFRYWFPYCLSFVGGRTRSFLRYIQCLPADWPFWSVLIPWAQRSDIFLGFFFLLL